MSERMGRYKMLGRALAGAGSVVFLSCLPSGRSEAQEREKFHQGVDYRIEAYLDEGEETLRARARFRYTHRGHGTIDTLFFHQHLNAFRPNSDWARRDLEFGNRRFTDLGPEDHAFERLLSVSIDGSPADAIYPGSPDSTVVAFALETPLEQGESATVLLDWESRPSTLPRRQGRRGRHYDFAQWYPRIAVYDEGGWQVQPLMPQGEFYGEFATYDVTLDVAQDQVIGATGVPVQGDPGWAGASSAGATEESAPPQLRDDFYGSPPEESLGLLAMDPETGRKRVRWHARDVHHFAWSTNPDYTYEGGRHGDLAIHVLYQPGDETSWGNRVAVDRTIRAVEWLETVFGPYPYPQVTNVHRIEGGGTEFPMMVMNGSASQGLITHEVGHIYGHGILANNEWKDAWLDEGFISFMTSWFAEEADGATRVWERSLGMVAAFEDRVTPQPVAIPSADFLDPRSYSTYSYSKGSIFFYMLRELMGWDDFRRATRLYFETNKFEHVNEYDFRVAAEAVYGEDLSWFFHQWLHTTHRLDYELRSAETEQQDDGSWITELTVARNGEAWMPLEVQVGSVRAKLDSKDALQKVSISTQGKPESAVLDPDMVLLESTRENNRKVVEER
ncbi:MAG: M1 family metallopeptidase [Gemmatimonadetes bacterium]|nr:M1 family metallopeptidase [Gemmatimonadota bacterium]NNM05464.1 M1 family metallopeptidase [Gemmatimonadota bacterium]